MGRRSQGGYYAKQPGRGSAKYPTKRQARSVAGNLIGGYVTKSAHRGPRKRGGCGMGVGAVLVVIMLIMVFIYLVRGGN